MTQVNDAALIDRHFARSRQAQSLKSIAGVECGEPAHGFCLTTVIDAVSRLSITTRADPVSSYPIRQSIGVCPVMAR